MKITLCLHDQLTHISGRSASTWVGGLPVGVFCYEWMRVGDRNCEAGSQQYGQIDHVVTDICNFRGIELQLLQQIIESRQLVILTLAYVFNS